MSDKAQEFDFDVLLQSLLDKGLGPLLQDKAVKKDILEALAECGLRAPANHIFLFVLTKAMNSLVKWGGQALKSRLQTFVEKSPFLSKFMQNLARLDAKAAKNQDIKAHLLAGLESERLDSDLTVDDTDDLNTIMALHQSKRFEGLEADIAALQDTLIDAIETQFQGMIAPDLTWLANSDPQSMAEILRFDSTQHGFAGREAEFEQLLQFLGDPSALGGKAKFQWLTITGPGGEGKTRLAFEFVKAICDPSHRHYQRHWTAGRLDLRDLKRLMEGQIHWRPQQPTFMVVDYPANAPRLVGQFIEYCIKQSSDAAINCIDTRAGFEFPVRLLLLERDTQGQWYQDLLAEARHGKAHIYLRDQYEAGWALARLRPDVLMESIETRFQGSGLAPPDRVAFLKKAAEIDPAPYEHKGQVFSIARPLFAWALAELAIARMTEGADFERAVHNLNRETVFGDLIARDRVHRWSPIAPDPVRVLHENLLALSTLCQGLDKTALVEAYQRDAAQQLSLVLPSPFAGGTNPIQEGLLAVMSSGGSDSQYGIYEPDLLGEFFALERLESLSAPEREILLTLAYEIGEDRFGITYLRLMNDFPKWLSDLGGLLLGTMSEKGAVNLGRVCVHAFAYFYARRGLVSFVGRILEQIQHYSLETRHLDTARLTAKALFNKALGAGEIQDWPKVDQALTQLNKVKQVFPHDIAIATIAANAMINLIDAAGTAKEWNYVDRAFEELDAGRAAFPDDLAIELIVAKATVNLIVVGRKAKDLSRFTVGHQKLYQLWLGHAQMFEGDDSLEQAVPDFKNWAEQGLKPEDLPQIIDESWMT